MKALTVRQPHAQLIALGVKTIETRTKPTKYRGPLLIHAAATMPSYNNRYVKGYHCQQEIRQLGGKWFLSGPKLASWPDAKAQELPLGAIVASCKLVGCVPVVRHEVVPEKPGYYIEDYVNPGDGQHRLWVLKLRSDGSIDTIDKVERQRPYGDFTPGRFAWLLEDIKPTTERCPACWGTGARAGIPSHQLTAGDSFSAPPCPICHSKRTCDPIPAKGKQGLWEWIP